MAYRIAITYDDGTERTLLRTHSRTTAYVIGAMYVGAHRAGRQIRRLVAYAGRHRR